MHKEMFYYIHHSRCIPLLWVWPGWREFTAPDCSLQYRLIILGLGIGTKTGKGRWLWQHTDHSAEPLLVFCCWLFAGL